MTQHLQNQTETSRIRWEVFSIENLTDVAIERWVFIQEYWRLRNFAPAISQSTAWAIAGRALGIPHFLIMSPDSPWGGWVYRTPVGLDCTNGPLLDWKNSAQSAKQVQSFRQVLLQMADSVSLRPRWTFSPEGIWQGDQAATWRTDLTQSPSAAGRRARRTIRHAEKNGVQVSIQSLTEAHLYDWNSAKGHAFPKEGWFYDFLSGARREKAFELWHVEARSPCGLVTRLMIAERGSAPLGEAIYLFGFDEGRTDQTPARLSTSSLAHESAMSFFRDRGNAIYDWNGILAEPRQNHSYLGVNEFKRQWRGSVLNYYCPEIY